MRILLALLGVLAACVGEPRVRESALEAVGDSAGAGGVLVVPLAAEPAARLRVRLEGLEPGQPYLLSLDAAEPGSQTSSMLETLAVPGRPLGMASTDASGAAHGFWDFERIRADERGLYTGRLTLAMPPFDYRVRLLVKRVQGETATTILQSEPFLLSVDPHQNARRWVTLAGLAMILASFALLLGLRRRVLRGLRRHTAGPAPAPAPHAGMAQEVSAGVTPGVGTREPAPPGGTRVDQARTDGILVHQRSYAWIEIRGRRKAFRPRQALIFQILCEHDPDCDGMPQEQIIEEWQRVYNVARANPVRVVDIFRSHVDEPGDFIERMPGPASMYRLRLDPGPPPGASADDEPEGDALGDGFGELEDAPR